MRILQLTIVFLFLALLTQCSRKTAAEKEEEREKQYMTVPEAKPNPELMPRGTQGKQPKTSTGEAKGDPKKEKADLIAKPADTLRYQDYVYRSNIKTVQIHRAGKPLSYPVIPVNSAAQLQLSFDDLDAGVKTFNYTFVLCDANWQPADIDPFNYLEGYSEGRIDNYQQSSQTMTNYTHYSLSFPNDELKPTKSGNYLLKVYKDSDEDSLVVTKRFHITEDQVSINGKVKKPNVPQRRETHQKVDFTINHKNFNINNPFEEVKVVVQQNGRWDNAITGLKPKFAKNNTLEYRYQKKLLFEGLKEFRLFDIQNLRQLGRGVKRIDDQKSVAKVFLQPDKLRSYNNYRFYNEMNGQYVIGNENRNHPATQADYVKVHFQLNFNNVISDGNIYLFGELTDWQFQKQYRMQWNYDKKQYETTLLLKQGFYNYLYAFRQQGQQKPDFSMIEGSYHETENKYRIYVYYRPTGARHDRLINVKTLAFN